MTILVTVTEPTPIEVVVSPVVIDVTASGLAGSLATVAAAADVDMTGAATGSLLVYNATTQTFEASGALDGLTLDGGSY